MTVGKLAIAVSGTGFLVAMGYFVFGVRSWRPITDRLPASRNTR